LERVFLGDPAARFHKRAKANLLTVI
jgi:hypothetical protein